jgi:hypothetical protein
LAKSERSPSLPRKPTVRVNRPIVSFISEIQTVMAAGERNFGTIIPANSALVFDVELMDLKPKPGSRDEL